MPGAQSGVCRGTGGLDGTAHTKGEPSRGGSRRGRLGRGARRGVGLGPHASACPRHDAWRRSGLRCHAWPHALRLLRGGRRHVALRRPCRQPRACGFPHLQARCRRDGVFRSRRLLRHRRRPHRPLDANSVSAHRRHLQRPEHGPVCLFVGHQLRAPGPARHHAELRDRRDQRHRRLCSAANLPARVPFAACRHLAFATRPPGASAHARDRPPARPRHAREHLFRRTQGQAWVACARDVPRNVLHGPDSGQYHHACRRHHEAADGLCGGASVRRSVACGRGAGACGVHDHQATRPVVRQDISLHGAHHRHSHAAFGPLRHPGSVF